VEIGPHVGLKRLIAYRQGTLPAAEREDLQEHLSLCERCTGRLLELRDFEAAAAGGGAAGPESLRQEVWESLERRLPRQGSAIRPIAAAAQREAPRRLPRFAYAAVAALLLAVAGFAVWSAVTAQQDRARLEERLAEREDALGAVQRSLAEAERQLDLERERVEPAGRVDELEARVAELTSALEELRRTTRAPEKREQTAAASQQIALSVAPRFALRGQEPTGSGLLRGGGAVNSVPAQGDRIGVELTLADHPVYSEYRFELLDRNGQVLWTGRRPGKSLLGDAGTKVSIQGLGQELYTLRIEGLRPDRTDLLAVYLLEVTRTGEPARD
jgi:hypothetical protein